MFGFVKIKIQDQEETLKDAYADGDAGGTDEGDDECFTKSRLQCSSCSINVI